MSNIMDFWRNEWKKVTDTSPLFGKEQSNEKYNFRDIQVTDYDYNKLKKNYNKNGDQILKKNNCLSYLRNQTPPTNTCAIKLSWSLNKSGYYIPESKDTPPEVRIQSKGCGKHNSFILDAKSMVSYLGLIQSPTLYFKKEELDTNEKIDLAIEKIHNYDDMEGIIGLVADNVENYGATGHIDLLYEDFMWDISMYGHYGNDLAPYLKGCLNREKTVKFDMSIWVLNYDS